MYRLDLSAAYVSGALWFGLLDFNQLYIRALVLLKVFLFRAYIY